MNLQQFVHSADKKHRQSKLVLSIVLPVLLLLAAVVSQIANGDIVGWNHGFNHPLEGWDHLVTMLAVGIWAAQMRGHSIWLLPLSFVGVMSLGGFAGALGLSIPSVEGIILLSTAVFSILVTRKIRFSTKMNVLIVAFFAFFHGFAHGQEISTSASLLSYTLGFMLATLLLHGAGIIIAKLVLMFVACLISMIFSFEAQANLTFNQNSKALLSVTNENLAQPLWNENSFHFKSIINDIDDRSSTSNRLSDHTRFSNVLEFSTQPLKNMSACHIQNNADKTSGFSVGIILPHDVENSIPLCDYALQLRSLVDFQSFELSRTVFNDYYPDINHSPGTDLLSSGVGLNSPPTIAANFRILFVVPHFACLKAPTLEAQSLLLANSKALIEPTANFAQMLRRPCCAYRFYHSQHPSSTLTASQCNRKLLADCNIVILELSQALPFFLQMNQSTL